MVIGGYGHAGTQIVDLLLAVCEAHITVAGRNLARASRFVQDRKAYASRLSGIALDARNSAQLGTAATGMDLVIVAAGTSSTVVPSALAVIAAGADFLDIQVSAEKVHQLQALDEQVSASGRCIVTDGGFHPGLPAAMIRHAAASLPELETAHVSSVIAINWRELSPTSDATVEELMDAFRDYAYEEFADGCWRRAGRPRKVSFPAPFGQRYCSAMGLAEMRAVTASLPMLRAGGFRVAGFNFITDFLVIPIVMAGMKFAPSLMAKPLARLLRASITHGSRPPYGTVLQLDGGAQGDNRTLLRVSHVDAYTMTAAPVVATILQLLDGSARRPGVHLQAMLVDTPRFFADLQRLGIQVDRFFQHR
ncbi:saccharopine dehydrogenase NADP-binding domain-containing protein [Brenneria goodwinii]|uniref:saccharopine dehydrogenase NADP-binding domain-containing protein n=1 Tax=Brenneria goodwinii TaxID=1109412 RepID=UPI0036F085F5